MTPRLDSSHTACAAGTVKAAGGSVGQAGCPGSPVAGAWGAGAWAGGW